MTAGHVFSIANFIAAAGWVVLIIFGRKKWVPALVTGAILPLLFAVLYSALLVAHWADAKGGFATLADVQALFADEWILLAGWIHYLAFDLFVGSWEVRDASRHGLPHWCIIPGLILTFLFGPAGLVLYFLVRIIKGRKLYIDLPSML